MPVLVSLFNTRLNYWKNSYRTQQTEVGKQAVTNLREMLGRVPRDSFPVKKVLGEIEQAWADAFWTLLTPAKVDFLRVKVGPLLRFAANVDVAAETFTNKVERLKLQIAPGQPGAAAPSVHLRRRELADRRCASRTRRCQTSRQLALSPDLATATPAQLTQSNPRPGPGHEEPPQPAQRLPEYRPA